MKFHGFNDTLAWKILLQREVTIATTRGSKITLTKASEKATVTYCSIAFSHHGSGNSLT